MGSTTTTLGVDFTIAEPGWRSFLGRKPGPSVNAVDDVAAKFLAVTDVASPACNSTVWVPVGDTVEGLASARAEIDDFVVQMARPQSASTGTTATT